MPQDHQATNTNTVIALADEPTEYDPTGGVDQYFLPYPTVSFEVLKHDPAEVEDKLKTKTGIFRSRVDVRDQDSQFSNSLIEDGSRFEDGAHVKDSLVQRSIIENYAHVSKFSHIQGSRIDDRGHVENSAVMNGSRVFNQAHVDKQSIVSGRSRVEDRATVSSSNVFSSSRIMNAAYMRDSRAEGSRIEDRAQVHDSLVTAKSRVMNDAHVEANSLVASSQVEDRVKVKDSIVAERAGAKDDAILRNKSVLRGSTIEDKCVLDGSQARAGAKLINDVTLLSSVAIGVLAEGRCELRDRSVVIGERTHRVSNSIVTGKSVLWHTKAKNVFACCGSRVQDCSLDFAYVFGSSLKDETNDEILVKLGDGCVMATSTRDVPWATLNEDGIEDIWAQYHPEFKSVISARKDARRASRHWQALQSGLQGDFYMPPTTKTRTPGTRFIDDVKDDFTVVTAQSEVSDDSDWDKL